MASAGPQLRIVTGKGGVGKTTVATALGLALARRGQRVLIAEAHGGDSVTALLGAKPVGSEMREVLENLFVVDMNPRDTIREYALLTLHFEAVYKAVFENRLVQHFLRLVPSLGELVMLGKVRYHALQTLPDGRPRFDVVVLDAPATGHAISLLRAPAAVERTVPAGPLRDNARLIREMLADPDRTIMHIVTTPEEMPVTEAVELEQAATDVLSIRLGPTFINQRVPALPAGALQSMAELGAAAADPPLRRVLESLQIREDKRLAGEHHLERLPAHMLHNCIDLPRLVDPGGKTGWDQNAVRALAEAMTPKLAV